MIPHFRAVVKGKVRGKRTRLQIWVCRTVLSLYFSVNSDRKVPKEHRQRAKRPLDTRFSFMGLFDRGDTRARLKKHLRGTGGDAFLSAPKLTPRWARLVSLVKPWFLPRGRGSVLPLSAGRQPPLPCQWARSGSEPLGETIYFPSELGSQPRGRHSDGRAGYRVLATFRAIRLFRPAVGERAAQIRWWVS